MKLKYYLRGIGIGVIVATLIMTVSSVIHNNNLSDEMIIKEAMKLGMVMPDNTEDDDSLWSDGTENDTEVSSEITSENPTMETSTSESEVTTEETQVTEDAQNTESTQSTEETQNSEETQIPVDENMAVLTVDDTDAARHVSEKLMAAGLVEDAEDFRSYLANQGYASDIKSGTFQIPKGSTYEEICNIIIRK